MIQSVLGLPNETRLNCPVQKVTGVVDYPLPCVNLYRKLVMAQFGVFKLYIADFECNDPFIVREFLEKRIQQLPI